MPNDDSGRVGLERPQELGIDEMRARSDALAAFGLHAIRQWTFTGLLDEAARIVREVVGTDFSKVLELQPDGSLLVAAGAGWPDGVVGELEVPGGGDSQASHAMRTREPVVVEDLRTERRFQPAPVFRELGVVSSVNVVIEGETRPFGVLEVDSKQPREFSSADVSFMQAMANVLSSAVLRKRHDEEREQLLGLVSHELRNPLTVVLGFASQLTRGLAEGASVERHYIDAAQAIRDSAERMERTLSMLMQLGQVEGEVAPQFETLDLSQLLAEVTAEARLRYPGVDVTEETIQTPAPVVTDELWARAALANIVGNAAKYSRLRPQVLVRLLETQEGFEVHVRDHCGGIGGEELDRLFDRFFRGNTSQGIEGLGLGLYISQRAAGLLGWHINVHSYPGDGCEFVVRLRADATTLGA